MKLWVDDVQEAPPGYLWARSVQDAKEYIMVYEDYLEGVRPTTIKECDKWRVELIDIGYCAGDYRQILDWMEETGRNYTFQTHFVNPVSVQNLAANGEEEMQSGETNWQKLLRMNPEEKRNLLFKYFSKWAGIGDSYIYDLTRVKEGFSVGTVSLDDFVEWDEERIGIMVDEFMQWLEQRQN